LQLRKESKTYNDSYPIALEVHKLS